MLFWSGNINCPSFQISEYGLFDSRVKFPHLTQTEPRPVTEFELEFYPTDYSGTAYLNDEPRPMQRGCFLCTKPGQTRYSLLHYRCYYIHLTTNDPALNALMRSLPDSGVISHMPQMTQLFRPLVLLDPDEPTAALTVQSAVCQIISLLIRDLRSLSQAKVHTDLVLKAEQYIQTHLSEPLTLEAVAAAVNLSPFYFHRLFTEFFCCTPAQYILSCRIANAKLELLKENCSLPTLIARCGFSSQSYFCYKFKKITGKTPLQYRKETLSRLEL